jgi:hypothetical protein
MIGEIRTKSSRWFIPELTHVREPPRYRIRAPAKKGVWGESRLAFESIVEEVRWFVARMPPVDSTTGSVCCPRSFSALRDQRAEILPVQRPPARAVGGRCMMRLTRLLMFPFFPLSILDQLPLHRGAFQNAQRNFLWKLEQATRIYRPVNSVETKICHKGEWACAVAKTEKKELC